MTYIECTDPGRDSGHHGHTHSPYPRSVVAVLPWFNFSLNRVLPTPSLLFLSLPSPPFSYHNPPTHQSTKQPTNPQPNRTPPHTLNLKLYKWKAGQSSNPAWEVSTLQAQAPRSPKASTRVSKLPAKGSARLHRMRLQSCLRVRFVLSFLSRFSFCEVLSRERKECEREGK